MTHYVLKLREINEHGVVESEVGLTALHRDYKHPVMREAWRLLLVLLDQHRAEAKQRELDSEENRGASFPR